MRSNGVDSAEVSNPAKAPERRGSMRFRASANAENIKTFMSTAFASGAPAPLVNADNPRERSMCAATATVPFPAGADAADCICTLMQSSGWPSAVDANAAADAAVISASCMLHRFLR
eukprot:5727052-Pleurochrysis_carterae.AAC.2